MKKILHLLLIVLPITACANSLQVERRDYILSKPHGWISLSVVDLQIPDILNPDTKKLVKPSRCYLTATVNSEIFLSAPVYPDGETPSYNLNTGFRFPIPIGTQNIRINYSGCRVSESGETSNIDSIVKLNVSNNMVYEINFANETFALDSEKLNEEVTLKQIYEALKQ